MIIHRRRGTAQQTGGGCRRQVFFGTTVFTNLFTVEQNNMSSHKSLGLPKVNVLPRHRFTPPSPPASTRLPWVISIMYPGQGQYGTSP
ncbi:hypothetical protein Y032_0265g655 [Ancylostoma ceylanicum]|uniref:Uncharacterized protein n=1 Tax=Ancylostoma ceylanicum TaxID=53326 RepID=A0A016SAJ8_9BILA|nr:hypothetical protein Y032_0265g655 [Ancylostoma ceylanicum]